MKKIVICPNEAKRFLLTNYRKDNPFCDIKFLTKDDVLRNFKYSYTADAIKYLIEKHDYDYETAKSILDAISFLKGKNCVNELKDLFLLKDELIKNDLLIENLLFDEELKRAKIEICFYNSLDKELLDVLKDTNFKFISFENKKLNNLECYSFSSIEDEVFYVTNRIAKLIKEGISPEKIKVFGLTEDYNLVFDRACASAGLNSNINFDTGLFGFPPVKKFFDNFDEFYEKQNIKEILNEYENDYPLVIDYIEEIVNLYFIKGISKDKQKKLFRDVFSHYTCVKQKKNNAISSVNLPLVKDDEYLFIANSVHGNLPYLEANDSYLDDTEKQKLGILTSSERNNIQNIFYKNLIQFCNHLVITRSRIMNGNETVFPIILEEMRIVEKNDPYLDCAFGNREPSLLLGHNLDMYRKYLDSSNNYLYMIKDKVDILYLTYNPQFNGTNIYDKNSLIKLSYTSLKNFYLCKYKFYLNHVLKIDDAKSFEMKIGNIIHYILQNINQTFTNEEFNDLFNKALEKNALENDKEEVLIKKIKEEAKKIANFVISFEKQVKNGKALREEYIEFNLNPNVILNGKIDKIVLSGDNQKYVSLIDYKTGSEEFNESKMEYGLSTQLPIYSLLIKNSKNLSSKELIGIYIERVLSDKLSDDFNPKDKIWNEQVKMVGMSIDNIDKIKTVDSTCGDEYTYIGKLFISKNGSFKKNTRVRNTEWFDGISLLAEKLALDAARQILNNEFEINPKVIKDKNEACKYCSFKDICFRKREFEVYYENDEENGEEA